MELERKGKDFYHRFFKTDEKYSEIAYPLARISLFHLELGMLLSDMFTLRVLRDQLFVCLTFQTFLVFCTFSSA